MTIKTDALQAHTFYSVAYEYLLTPQGARNLLTQTPLRFLQWVIQIQSTVSPLLKNTKNFFATSHQSFFWLDLPKKLKKLKISIFHFKEALLIGKAENIFYNTRKLFAHLLFTFTLFTDTIEILYKDDLFLLSPIQLEVLKIIGLFGSIALFIHTLPKLQKQITTFSQARIGSPESYLALMRVASKTCLLMIATTGCVMCFVSTSVLEFASLTLLTALLGLSISTHFYEKLYIKKSEKTH